MKEKIVVYALVIMLSNTINTSQKTAKQVNCDELAAHIQGKMQETSLSLSQKFKGLFIKHNDYSEVWLCERAPHWIFIGLSKRNDQFIRYRNALQYCMKSGSNYPVATQTLEKLNKEINLGLQCQGLRENADQELDRQQKKQEREKQAHEKYISDHAS